MKKNKTNIRNISKEIAYYEKERSNIITFFLSAFVVVFPLILFNAYFNVLEAKYITYCVIMIGMLSIVALLNAIDSFSVKSNNKNSFKIMLKNFLCNKNDIAATFFLLIVTISTLLSDYVSHSIWGTFGRYSGLFLITLYISTYFIISKYWIFNERVMLLFFVSSSIVMLLGITDFFKLNLLGLQTNLQPSEKDIFISTIGNINTFVAFVTIVIGLSSTLFVIEQNKQKKIFFYVITLLGFLSGVAARSNSFYMSIITLFIVLPFFSLKSKHRLFCFFILIISFLISAKILTIISLQSPNSVVPLDDLIITLFSSSYFWIITFCIIATTVSVWFFPHPQLPKQLLAIYIAIISVILLLLLFVLIDINIGGNIANYSFGSDLVLVDDDWGSFRGAIWRSSIEIFKDFNLINKLVGYGPDTFIILMSGTVAEKIFLETGVAVDNAHNEYIHYLLTIGLMGLTAYIIFLILCLKRILKVHEVNIYSLACFVSVVCYLVQASLNLNLPIVTPLMYLFLSIGVAISNKNSSS